MSKTAGATFGVLAGVVVGGALGALVGSRLARTWEPVQFRVGAVSLGALVSPRQEVFMFLMKRDL